jgi:hypothetical protein
MITLKGLKRASLQRIFDQAALHLLTQNRQSLSKKLKGASLCRYRNDDGLKCAVGCFIADDEYHPSMEGQSSDDITVKFNINFYRKLLLGELQLLHDMHKPHVWPEKLKELAKKHNLKFSKKNLTR